MKARGGGAGSPRIAALQIFLSYRRGDAGGYAGRLHDTLVQRLGREQVFQDIFAIPPGQDFRAVLDRALDRANVVLAVIGPAWLSATTDDGVPRLDDEQDFVRMELTRALDRGLPVVPVLVGGAPMPQEQDLPERLQELARRQAVTLHNETWGQDVDELLRRLGGGSTGFQRRHLPRRLAAATLLAAVALAAWQILPGGDGATPLAGSTEVPVSSPAPVATEPAREEATVEPAETADGIVPCTPPQGEGWQDLALIGTPTGRLREAGGRIVVSVQRARWRAGAPGTWSVILATTMDNRTAGDQYHGEWRYESLIVGRRAFGYSCFSPQPDLVGPGTVGDALIGFDVGCQPQGYIELVLAQAQDRFALTPHPEPGAC